MKDPSNSLSLLRSYQVRVTAILLIVQAVGLIGLSFYRELFLPLTPLNLLFATGLLLSDHRDLRPRFWFFAAIVIIGGLALEILGVRTGMVFGTYHYTDLLGPSIAGVPLVIGSNWLLLIYLTGWASHRLVQHALLTPFLGALFMLAFDLLLEPAAIALNFWVWEQGLPPLQNYAAWFLMAFGFHSLAWKLKVRLRSRVAMPLLVILTLFFLCIVLTV